MKNFNSGLCFLKFSDPPFENPAYATGYAFFVMVRVRYVGTRVE